jgi:hypothetical protein
MIAGLAIFIIIMSLVWLLFSDSIIKMWYAYVQEYKDKVKAKIDVINEEYARLRSVQERKENPPKCEDCHYFTPYANKPGFWELGKCTHPESNYSYAESEREQIYAKCGKYGDNFKEKT